ncbi:MAG: O-antigen ligase family protein [Armatimonadota bacterium]|nr:O-antigen ligase family protein [Armatimonadota bacterium]
MMAERPASNASVKRLVAIIAAAGIAGFCVISGLGLALNPTVCSIGLGALLVVVFLCTRPELALPVALFTVPLDLLGHVTPDGTITAAKLLILLAIGIWAARTLIHKDRYPLEVLWHPVSLLMFAFLAINVLSLVNARALEPAALYLVRRTNVVVFALLVAVVIRDRRSWDRALVWMTLAGVPIVFFGLYELITAKPILALVSYRSQDELLLLSGEHWRIHGTFDDGPFHAIYVVTVVSLSLCWLLRTRNRWIQAGLCALIALLLVNLIGTASRGGVMGLVVVLAVFWVGLGMRRKWVLAAGLVGCAAGVFLVAAILPQVPLRRYVQLSPKDDPTTQIRVGLYSVGMGMIADHPVLGVGTGNWMRNYQRYATADTFKETTYHPHNTYLQILAENGLLGMAVYLLLLSFTTYQFVLALRRTPDRDGRLPILAAMGAFLAFAAFATTSNVMENETYWIFIGFSIVASQLPTSKPEATTGEA